MSSERSPEKPTHPQSLLLVLPREDISASVFADLNNTRVGHSSVEPTIDGSLRSAAAKEQQHDHSRSD